MQRPPWIQSFAFVTASFGDIFIYRIITDQFRFVNVTVVTTYHVALKGGCFPDAFVGGINGRGKRIGTTVLVFCTTTRLVCCRRRLQLQSLCVVNVQLHALCVVDVQLRLVCCRRTTTRLVCCRRTTTRLVCCRRTTTPCVL